MRTLLRLTIPSLLLVAATFAGAQVVDHAPLRVNIPFAFIAGDSSLPAGEYIVRPISAERELIQGKNGHAIAFAPPHLSGDAGSASVLIFHQYGDKYFLAEVWPAGSRIGRLVGGSATLRRAQGTLVARQVTVISETKKSANARQD